MSGWVDEVTARELLSTTPAVIVEDPGPLKVAVRMWRQKLVLRLKPPETLPMPQPTSVEKACAILADHAVRAASATRDLITATAPPGHGSALASQVGPLGLRAMVHPPEQGFGGRTWPVSYQSSDIVDVHKALDADPHIPLGEPEGNWRRSTIDGLTRLSPEAEAVNRVRSAIEELTTRSWLAP